MGANFRNGVYWLSEIGNTFVKTMASNPSAFELKRPLAAGGTPTRTIFHEKATLSQQYFAGLLLFLPATLNRSRRHSEFMVLTKGIG